MSEVIAIIPARSGSKGLKNKNIKDLNGKPLLTYSIDAAIESGIFKTVHVSTDSEEYAQIARSGGAEVPFLRDAVNSGDQASSWDVVREVILKYKELGISFEECVLLQPTSPLRKSIDIKEAYEIFKEKMATSLVSVCEVRHPIQWCFQLDSECSMEQYANSPYRNMNRQSLEKYYQENGSIYILKTNVLFEKDFDFYRDRCMAYIMDKSRSVDIDDELDFKIAETILRSECKES